MKRTGLCTKCSGRRVIKLAVVPDAGDWIGSGSGDVTDRSGDAHTPRMILPTWRGGVSGKTEAYVCAECGWFEEYIASPQDIAWDDIAGQWATHKASPYRG